MNIAENIIRRHDNLFRDLPEMGKGTLRFGRSLVSVSAIAGQYYCEKKLELENEYPLPPTERMQEGEAGHEAVTALAEPLTREEAILEAVEEREEAICLYEFDIWWVYKDIPIIGRLDEAWFRGGNVDLVVERKCSDRMTVYNPYHVQAQLYCMGLGEMGFNNASTNYRIMVFKRSCFECTELIERSCSIFNVRNSEFLCDKGESIAFIYPFKKEEIIKDLDWALDYWLGKREAIPTKNIAKCRVCKYNSLCSSALIK